MPNNLAKLERTIKMKYISADDMLEHLNEQVRNFGVSGIDVVKQAEITICVAQLEQYKRTVKMAEAMRESADAILTNVKERLAAANIVIS